MSFTYTPGTDIAKLRMLIADTVSAPPPRPIFTDEELGDFIAMAGHYWPAAAMAVNSIAINEVLVQKVMTIMGTQTDGAAMSKELRQLAKQIKEDYKEFLTSELGFATAEMPDGTFAYKEALCKNYMRGLI